MSPSTYGAGAYGAGIYPGPVGPVMIYFVNGPFDGERQMTETVPHNPGDAITVYTDGDPYKSQGMYAFTAVGPPPGPNDTFTEQYIFTFVPPVS